MNWSSGEGTTASVSQVPPKLSQVGFSQENDGNDGRRDDYRDENEKEDNNKSLSTPLTSSICFPVEDEDSRSGSDSKSMYNHIPDSMKTALFNLHDDFSSPNIIHNIAKKWTLCAAKGNFQNLSEKEKASIFDEIIQEEIHAREPLNKKKINKIITWNEIGGISYVKNELTKILQWPIKVSK